MQTEKKTKCALLAAEGYPSIICTIPMNRWFRLDNNSCTDILWTDALLSNLDSSLERRCPVCFEPFGILLGNGLFHFIYFCLMISAPRDTGKRCAMCLAAWLHTVLSPHFQCAFGFRFGHDTN